ncbi:hypothetical protein ACWDTI_05085 [Gordonia sp. NPDC003424]
MPRPNADDDSEPFALRFGPAAEGIRCTVACDARDGGWELRQLSWRQLREGRFIAED